MTHHDFSQVLGKQAGANDLQPLAAEHGLSSLSLVKLGCMGVVFFALRQPHGENPVEIVKTVIERSAHKESPQFRWV